MGGVGGWGGSVDDEAGRADLAADLEVEEQGVDASGGHLDSEADRSRWLVVERVHVEEGEVAVATGDEVPGRTQVEPGGGDLAVTAARHRHPPPRAASVQVQPDTVRAQLLRPHGHN